MTMSLIAHAAIHQLRLRLGQPAADWDAEHLASNFFQGLEGDIRVSKDTVLVTYYDAPNAELLRSHYENLPAKLRQQGIDPRIPWLYNFLLDFRFMQVPRRISSRSHRAGAVMSNHLPLPNLCGRGDPNASSRGWAALSGFDDSYVIR